VLTKHFEKAEIILPLNVRREGENKHSHTYKR
jgi:hypothetical protein